MTLPSRTDQLSASWMKAPVSFQIRKLHFLITLYISYINNINKGIMFLSQSQWIIFHNLWMLSVKMHSPLFDVKNSHEVHLRYVQKKCTVST